MKKNRLFLITLVCLVLAGTVSLSLAKETTTIRLAFWGGQEDVDINTEAAKLFEKKNLGIKIIIEYIPKDYDTKLMTMIAGGNAPDVIQMAESLAVYAQKGSVIPLENFIKKDNLDTSIYFPSVLAAFKVSGIQYGMPHRWGPMILYYNKNLFDQAGVEYPKDWTWDEFLEASKKLATGKGRNKIFAYANVSAGWWPWYMYPIMQFGSPILNDDRTSPAFNREKAAAALKFLYDLMYKYEVAPTPNQMASFDNLGPDQLFEMGRVAMNATGYWAVEGLRKIKGLNWDVAWMPKGEKNVAPMFGACWAITSAAKDKEAAWKVVRFYAGEEYARLLAKTAHDIPSIKAVAYSEEFLNPNLPPAGLKLILDSADYAMYPPTSDKWNVLIDAMGSVLDKYFKQEIPTAEAAVDEMVEKIKAEFGKN